MTRYEYTFDTRDRVMDRASCASCTQRARSQSVITHMCRARVGRRVAFVVSRSLACTISLCASVTRQARWRRRLILIPQ